MKEEKILQAFNGIEDVFLQELLQPTVAKSGKKRRLSGFVLLAALLSVLGLNAFASEYSLPGENWFYAFFADSPQPEAAQPLSENQQAVLDRGLVEINQSVTENGWTFTMESGICDGRRMLLKYRVDGPEGTVLNAQQCDIGYSSDIRPPDWEVEGYSAVSCTQHALKDADPSDNSITMLMDYLVQPGKDMELTIAGGTVWTISFHSIRQVQGQGTQLTEKILCQGDWTFRVTFADKLLVTDSKELLSRPVSCAARRQLRQERYDIDVTVTSFELRTLSAVVRFRRPLTGYWEGVDLEPIYIVLKDGTRLEARFRMGVNQGSHFGCVLVFDRPISAEDVAFVDFP